ncbi:MAG: hypothetical protein ABI586_11230, partial [Candidatus Nanopelagicales bacterium]
MCHPIGIRPWTAKRLNWPSAHRFARWWRAGRTGRFLCVRVVGGWFWAIRAASEERDCADERSEISGIRHVH